MPALHCAITRSGTEMMKSGAPITGIDRRPLNNAGIDISRTLFAVMDDGQPLMPWHQSKCGGRAQVAARQIALLADGAGHIGVGAAFAFVGLAPRQQRLGRAVAGGVDVEALAFLEALGLAELVGPELAVGRAVRRQGTDGATL